MNLPDVNVLVNALRPDSPQHDVCRTWMDRTARSQRPFAVTSTVLAGAVSVLTHPRVFDPPSDLVAVLDELERLRRAPNLVTVDPGPRYWEIFNELCRDADARGNLVPDASLAAVTIEHGCRLITLDRDFARFNGLDWAPPS